MLEEDLEFNCPYCEVTNTLRVEPGAGTKQTFTIDCETCCQPILADVQVGPDKEISLNVRPENE